MQQNNTRTSLPINAHQLAYFCPWHAQSSTKANVSSSTSVAVMLARVANALQTVHIVLNGFGLSFDPISTSGGMRPGKESTLLHYNYVP